MLPSWEQPFTPHWNRSSGVLRRALNRFLKFFRSQYVRAQAEPSGAQARCRGWTARSRRQIPRSQIRSPCDSILRFLQTRPDGYNLTLRQTIRFQGGGIFVNKLLRSLLKTAVYLLEQSDRDTGDMADRVKGRVQDLTRRARHTIYRQEDHRVRNAISLQLESASE